MLRKVFDITSLRGLVSAYTCIFVLMSFIVFLPWVVAGKALFIEGSDGLDVVYTTTLYFDRWVRSSIKSLLFNDGGEVFPAYDFSIGQGEGIFVTLSHSGFTDPFNLLTVFVPSRLLEGFLFFLVIMRLWVAGLGIILWWRECGFEGVGVLAGAFVYIFCGYMFNWADRWIPFLNLLVYFPFILVGVERVLKGGYPLLFILALALSAISNFSAYPTVVFGVAVFAVMRYFSVSENNTVISFINIIMRFFVVRHRRNVACLIHSCAYGSCCFGWHPCG